MLRRRGVGAIVVGLGALVLGLGLASGVAAVTLGHPKASIDDIQGVWKITFEEKNFDLVTGEESHHKTKAMLTITKIDSETVKTHYEAEGGGIWEDVAHYSAGVLVAGGANDPDLGDWAGTWYAEVDGKPSKWKLQGPYVSYDLNGGWTEVGTMSAKYVSPL